MSARDQILANLRQAPNHGAALPAPFPPSRAPQPTEDLWHAFQVPFAGLGGKMAELADIEPFKDQPVWLDEDAQPLLAGHAWTLAPSPWEAAVGFTTARLAVAETGSLVLEAGPGKRRLASLAPPIHVVLIQRESIVASLEEAVAQFRERTTVLITGPSRTADIEGVLVRGVHGPRELWLVRL